LQRGQNREAHGDANRMHPILPDRLRIGKTRLALDVGCGQRKRQQSELVEGDEREAFVLHIAQLSRLDHIKVKTPVVADDDNRPQSYLCRADGRRLNKLDRADLRIERRLHECVSEERMSRGDGGRGLCGNEKVGAR
jgi:hypothetical protein